MIEVKSDKYNMFMATVVPGLEKVLEDELINMLKNIEIVKLERGKVIFCQKQDTGICGKLRCADNIYCIVDELPVGDHKEHLQILSTDLKKFKWGKIIEAFTPLINPAVIVSASRKGRQSYTRFDIENIIKDVILTSKAGHEGTSNEHDIAVRADIANGICRISIQLTPADFKFRGSSYSFSQGSIRPTIAAALIRISNPGKTDVFYDPFCGAGAISMERCEYPFRRVMASDINEDVVDIASDNLKDQVILYNCDATSTPVKSKSIDVIVSNPPWGKQIEVENVNILYINFLNECNRILRAEGRVYLLTDCREELLRAALATGFNIETLYSISLHGLRPDVFYLKKG